MLFLFLNRLDSSQNADGHVGGDGADDDDDTGSDEVSGRVSPILTTVPLFLGVSCSFQPVFLSTSLA